eukprot:jgi/Botrbrau1/1708/Bobra.116_2s0050.1
MSVTSVSYTKQNPAPLKGHYGAPTQRNSVFVFVFVCVCFSQLLLVLKKNSFMILFPNTRRSIGTSRCMQSKSMPMKHIVAPLFLHPQVAQGEPTGGLGCKQHDPILIGVHVKRLLVFYCPAASAFILQQSIWACVKSSPSSF